MAATCSSTKTALFKISKSLHKQKPPYPVQQACFSTSYERVQDPRNWPPVEGSTHDEGRKGRYEEESKIDEMRTDTATQATAKTTDVDVDVDVAEDLLDLAKETTDIAWDSAKNTSQKVGDTLVAEADENVLDTSEYRSIEDLGKLADNHHANTHHTHHV